MRIPLRLAAGETYTVRLHPRQSGSAIFGWAYVSCNAGDGTIHLEDGGRDQPEQTELRITTDGLFGTALRSISGRQVGLKVDAGRSGLQGELHLEIFESDFCSDPLSTKPQSD